jgi:hypothetical protein
VIQYCAAVVVGSAPGSSAEAENTVQEHIDAEKQDRARGESQLPLGGILAVRTTLHCGEEAAAHDAPGLASNADMDGWVAVYLPVCGHHASS